MEAREGSKTHHLDDNRVLNPQLSKLSEDGKKTENIRRDSYRLCDRFAYPAFLKRHPGTGVGDDLAEAARRTTLS